MTAPAFASETHRLHGFILRPLERSNAEYLGRAIAAMPPWSLIGWPAERLIRRLATPSPGLLRFEVARDGQLAGTLAIHDPWLHGPYLQLLAILPPWQGKGLGQQLLQWMEREARHSEARQLWVCVSDFNTRARSFYERFGFCAEAAIDALSNGASADILMRKRLTSGGG